MDAKLNPRTGSYIANGRCVDISNEIYIRLLTPLGSWWADPSLGSRLHELQREKDLPRVMVLARQYAEQALDPVIKGGRARRIAVAVSRPARGWLLLAIAAEDNGGVVTHLNLRVVL